MTKYYLIVLSLFCLSANAQTRFSEIDVQHYSFRFSLNDQNDTVKGRATIDIKFNETVKQFHLNMVKPDKDGKGMLISSVTENGKRLSFAQDSDVVTIKAVVSAGSLHRFTINYKGIPADGLIISKNKFGHRTFFGDNWPNRAHNWLPCADYPSDKATVEFLVTAPDHYSVIANGLKTEEKELPHHLKFTHWKENVPLPTKVMVIGVADFAVDHTGDVNGIPVYTYVFPENKDAGFKSYAVAKEILPFYIAKFGPYDFEKLANVQSKTIFGGMENAGAIFYFENSVTSRDIEELMAHEIAHQWFGDAASEKSFAHLWLSEGFATYMTNVYLENKYGTDTLQKREKADRRTVIRFEKTRLTPVVDTGVKTNFMQMLNANSYQKGGWVLHMLRRKLGDAIFFKGIRAYYAAYRNSNANTEEFKKIMEQASGRDLNQFFKQWLYTAGHPHLVISQSFDEATKKIHLSITQKQSTAYVFPLEISVDGHIYTININNQTTTADLPGATASSPVIFDPNINLLADFETMK